MRIHVHCFLPNRTTAIVRPTLRRTPAFIRGADSPASDDGNMVNAIFSSTGVVLCCLIFLSPPICSRSTSEGERRPPLTYPEFSLSSLTCLCLSPRSASLPLASLNPYLSRSFPSSRCTVCRLRRPSTVTKTGAARRPFTVYEGLLPPMRTTLQLL